MMSSLLPPAYMEIVHGRICIKKSDDDPNISNYYCIVCDQKINDNYLEQHCVNDTHLHNVAFYRNKPKLNFAKRLINVTDPNFNNRVQKLISKQHRDDVYAVNMRYLINDGIRYRKERFYYNNFNFKNFNPAEDLLQKYEFIEESCTLLEQALWKAACIISCHADEERRSIYNNCPWRKRKPTMRYNQMIDVVMTNVIPFLYQRQSWLKETPYFFPTDIKNREWWPLNDLRRLPFAYTEPKSRISDYNRNLQYRCTLCTSQHELIVKDHCESMKHQYAVFQEMYRCKNLHFAKKISNVIDPSLDHRVWCLRDDEQRNNMHALQMRYILDTSENDDLHNQAISMLEKYEHSQCSTCSEF